MSNKLDKFEEGVKQAINGFEAPYDPKAWAKLSQELDVLSGNTAGVQSGFISGMAAGIVAVGTWLAVVSGVQNTGVRTEVSAGIPNQTYTEKLNEPGGGPANEAKISEQPVKITREKQATTSEVVVRRVAESNATDESILSSPSNKEGITQSTADDSEYSIRVECPKAQLCLGESPHLIITTKGLFDEEQILVNGKITDEPIRFEKPGTYEIIPQGMAGERTVSGEPLIIEVLKQPVSQVNTLLSKDDYGRQRINFSIEQGADIEKVSWYENNKLVATGDSYNMIATQADLYQITSIVTDANGCADTTRTGASVSESYNLLAPSAFTPNGDGRNDTWMPEALMGIDVPFTLVIFDSKGKPVFETTDPYAVWTGKVAGEPVIPGSVYVWKSTVEFSEGIENFTGSITVVE
jgi:gliding motility-associated-like protein